MTTSRDLYNALREQLGLRWVAGRGGSENSLVGSFPEAAGQGMAGPLNIIHPNRVQLLGRAELEYLDGLETSFYQDVLDKLFSDRPAAVILADGIRINQRFTDSAEQNDTPVFHSMLPDQRVLNDLLHYLNQVLAERRTEHGVFMEVLGVGVLLTGGPGAGKSELALELIARGHRLIADDAPEFARVAPDTISGSSPLLLRDFLEVRGLGIIDIRAMFGDSAIKQREYLKLIVHLQPMNDEELKNIDRLQGSFAKRQFLGAAIDRVTLPVAPGREMAIMVEAAVRQYILLDHGYDSVETFITRQQEAIERNSKAP
jgi:HPr kinase/phosphorylase